MIQKLLIALSTVTLLSSCNSNKKADQFVDNTPAENLITRLDTLCQKGYMYGHQDDPFYGITWEWDRNGRSDTKELVGDYPAVFGFDLGGLEEDHDANLDSVPFEWIREEAIRHYERGGILTFSWHPRNPLTGSTAWDVSDTTVVKSILPGGENHEKFVGWMNKVTDFLSTIKTADGEAIPFILRPWHEYNGSWFWWGEKLCSPTDFKAFWNMFQDHVNSVLPTNVVWSFSPNLQGNWSDEKFLERWPGADRVDLLGCDAYQWGTEEDYVNGLTSDLDFLSAFAKKNNVLLAMTECGKVNSTTPDWFSRIFKPIIDKYPISYFLLWRNAAKEHFGASKDASTADDFIKLYNADNTLFLNNIQ